MSGVQNIGGITLTAGGVPVGGDVETLLLAISADRSNALNEVARGQAAQMQASNVKIATLNKALNELRSVAPATDTKDASIGNNPDLGFKGLTSDTINTLNQYGIGYSGTYAYGSGNYTRGGDGADKLTGDGAWGRLMEAVKTQIDTVSSSSQLDMIKLQGTINKANQAVEMMTNLVQKFSDTKGKIVGNIR